MAGKRHHIVPRFLQRGFASRIDGDTVLIWLYTKRSSAPKKEISTKDTIVSENFYGKKGSLNADNEITYIEYKKFSPLVNDLRSGKCDFIKSKTEIAELIAHFSIRTKVIRKGFQDISGKMLEGMKEITTDEQILDKVFLNPPENVIKDQIEMVLSDSKHEVALKPALEIFEMLGIKKDEIKDLISTLAISHFENEESKIELKRILQNQFSQFFDKSAELIPNSIKEGHIKSLANNTIPENRVEIYGKLKWNVYITNAPLILGDVACVFKEIGQNLFKPTCDLEKTGQIYLPISSNQILIGTAETEAIETNVKVLNEAFASCSYEQFVCCEKADDKIDLIKIIGTNAYLANEEEIEKGLGEIREEIEKIHFKGSE